MVFLSCSAVLAALVATSLASPVAEPGPAITPPPSVAKAKAKRASCTFSGSDGASLASVSQADCATIVLSAVVVPSGTTLDLSDLEDDTTVSISPVTGVGGVLFADVCSRSSSRARQRGNTRSGTAPCCRSRARPSPLRAPTGPTSTPMAPAGGTAKEATEA